MRKRRSQKNVSKTKDQRIADLEQELSQALAINERLQKQMEILRKRVEELERAGKRQATPFARRKRVEHRQRSGRKAGQGKFVQRKKPSPKEVSETKVEKLNGCPECGGKLRTMHQHEQFEVDIPEVKPTIIRYVTYSGYCATCKKRVRSRHPEQTSQATGAAGVVVGPRAKALASDLKHRLGASYGKVSEVLNDAFELQVCRSGWCRADQKLAEKARPVYEKLVELVRQCSVVHADETGWRIDTLSAWLWVFTNREATVYAIRDNRSSDVVIEVLGREFQGILASDCFLAYDDRRLKDWLKQKCLAHLLTDLKEMKENKTGRALHFARQLTLVLQQALALKAEKNSLDPFSFYQRSQVLEAQLDALIASRRRLSDRDNARFARRLRKHRAHLLRFLFVDDLEATNNPAERMLRPAVITRKTNGCNRTRQGADAHAILSSVLVTCHQHSMPILDYLVHLQRSGLSPSQTIPALPLNLDLPTFT
jgi:transposase